MWQDLVIERHTELRLEFIIQAKPSSLVTVVNSFRINLHLRNGNSHVTVCNMHYRLTDIL